MTRLVTSWTYNEYGAPATTAFDGTAASPAEGTDSLTYVYDARGRIDQLKRSSTVLTDYAYNGDDTILSRVDAGISGSTTYTRDWAGRLTSVAAPTGVVTGTANQSWRLDGTLGSTTYPTSPTETLTVAYDLIKRPTGITRANGGTLTRTYDRSGNVLSEGRSLGIAGDAGTNTQTFTYDALDRLIGSSGLATAQSYTYDQDGNRLTKVLGATTTTYRYDRTDQLIDQVRAGTTRTFAYDRFGNQTTRAEGDDSQTSLAYDVGNRLLSITPATGPAASFTFDALGRNRTRLANGVTETYGYDGASEGVVLLDRDTGSDISALVADGARLAVNTGSVRWSLFDLLGSSVGLIDAGRTLTDATRYDGWGESVATSGSTVQPWRFRGLLDVSPSGAPLYDMNARYYSPGSGTFSSLDSFMGSAMDPRTMNRYLYASANPATLIDPTGHVGCPSTGSKCKAGDKVIVTHPDGSVTTISPGTTSGGGTSGGSDKPKSSSPIVITAPDELDAETQFQWLIESAMATAGLLTACRKYETIKSCLERTHPLDPCAVLDQLNIGGPTGACRTRNVLSQEAIVDLIAEQDSSIVSQGPCLPTLAGFGVCIAPPGGGGINLAVGGSGGGGKANGPTPAEATTWIRGIANDVSGMGWSALHGLLSEAQKRTKFGRQIQAVGSKIHDLTFDRARSIVKQTFGDEWEIQYNRRTHDYDIFNKKTGESVPVELTTRSQRAGHLERYVHLTEENMAIYDFPKVGR